MNIRTTGCEVLGIARSTLRYPTSSKNDDDQRLAVNRLATQYGRYGYRKICELLGIEGRLINHKKFERLWREEGLQLPALPKRHKRLYNHDASIIRLRPHFSNHVWSIGLVHDKRCNGWPYKMLTLLDEETREAPAVTVANKLGSLDVLEALYLLLLKSGKP